MNPFLDDIDPGEYDAARPYFHPVVFERLAKLFKDRFSAALDVGCGTGHSTEALAAVSALTIGLDASAVMLQRARRSDLIPYVRGQAEHLPFRDSTFEIVTVGLGLHWFQREIFLGEANRVLRCGGWLLVYDSGFCGRMKGNPVFGDWVREYRQRFPAPPRDDEPTSPEVLRRLGFTTVRSDKFVHSEVRDLEHFVRYLATQSNVRIAAQREPEAAEAWLRKTLRPLFLTERATFECEGWSVLFQKAG